jgi:ribosomal protein L16/L10AE
MREGEAMSDAKPYTSEEMERMLTQYNIPNMEPSRLRATTRALEAAREAVGLATTAVPSMVMRADDPVGMMREVVKETEALREALEAAREALRRAG